MIEINGHLFDQGARLSHRADKCPTLSFHYFAELPCSLCGGAVEVHECYHCCKVNKLITAPERCLGRLLDDEESQASFHIRGIGDS